MNDLDLRFSYAGFWVISYSFSFSNITLGFRNHKMVEDLISQRSGQPAEKQLLTFIPVLMRSNLLPDNTLKQ